MATNTQTTHGKKIKWGIQELSNALITGADTSLARETKQYKNHIGETVSLHEYDHRMEATVNFTFLADTDVATVEAAIKTWAISVATGDIYGLAEGGSAVVSDLKITEANEEASTGTVTVTYWPQAVN
ncbi:MAG: hypothetical protein J6L64_07105 [Opitutales bacterium]|nr:hypothetical protein [Opitutales bacterium]